MSGPYTDFTGVSGTGIEFVPNALKCRVSRPELTEASGPYAKVTDVSGAGVEFVPKRRVPVLALSRTCS